MKLKSLLLSALMMLSAGSAWADVEINETNFPDENFRNYLLEQDYGSDGVLTNAEIAGVTSIVVSSKSIQSLKGIEFFTALILLYCDNNQLVSLDVSKNMALTRLRCYSNQLASLDVSKNTKLTELWCYSNQLTSFDVSGCTALTELMCDNNQLTSLDVSGCVALKHLTCIDNQLVSLNVSKNTALEKFTCPSNKLTSLDVSGCIMLTELRCYNNQLTSLDLSKNTALATLYCSSNQLTSLDVSKNTALTDLYCYNNQLTSLDVSKNTALTHLPCYQNKIKGEGMDAFVESLPTVSNLGLEIVYNSNEQNEMTTAQVAAAKAKGWIPKAYTGPKRWVNYVGVKPLPPMPDLSPEELLKVNMSSSDMSSWFIDKETQIKGSFVQVTKNISDTEYKTGSIQTADGKTHPYSYFYVPEFNPFSNPNVAFYLPYNLKGEYDIYLVTMPTWTYQNNFDEEKHRYRFKASIWEKDEQNNYPSTGTALTVDYVNTFETPEVDANVITDTTFIGTYDFQHAYTDDNTPGVILQINPNVLSSQRKTYSNSMIFAGVVLVAKDNEPQTGIAINEENFPDENFRNWLLSQSYGSDGKLTGEEIAGVTSIDVSSKSIQSLKGIEYFTELTTLYCSSNKLTSLDVSKNTALTELSCGANKLTSLDVSKNTALTWLSCYKNQLTSLDVSKNTALTGLHCYNNQLTSLDVSKNTKLWDLYCNRNQLTSLDVSKNTALTTLYCYSNQLTSLDVSKNTALTKLWCGGNQLTSLDVSECPWLMSLSCDNNQLAALDVSKNTGLTELHCNNNQLTSLDVSKNTALTRLECYENRLTSLDVSGNTKLTELWCYDNQLTSLDVSKNTALTELWCGGNQLTSLDVSKNTALTELECGANQLTSLDVSKNTALTYLSCYQNQLTSLDLSKNTALTSLSCFMNQIKGAAMDALVASLPTVSNYTMRVVYYENEQNVMTFIQVAAAKAKGWTPRYTTDGYDWKEYPGVDPSTGVNNVEASDSDDSAPWYTINGVELTEKPTAPGIYIHGGKKVIVK